MHGQVTEGAFRPAARSAALLSWLSVCASPAVAVPITVNELSERLNNVSSNDLGFSTGLQIILSADSVTPNGSAGTTATAQTTNLSTGLSTQIVIPFAPSTVVPNQFTKSIPYNSSLTGPWTFTFANGADQSVINPMLSLTGVAPAPFATNVTVSGSGLNPTFSWSYPSSVNGVTVLIYDKAGEIVNGILVKPDLVWAAGVPSGLTGSYTLPTTLDGGFSLTPDKQYDVVLKGEVLRNPLGGLGNTNIASQSDAYFAFTPVTSGVPVNLPMVNSNGGYTYSMTVQAGKEYFIDPSIAIGYDYQIGAGNPDFASVQLPNIQAGDFDLSYLEGSSLLTAMVAPGGTFEFPDGGVTRFDVTGIDPSLMLDPGDTTAFITGLTFAADGSFTGTQTPITENVPEPSSIILLGSGFAFLMLRRSQPPP
jgi:hypothetical protein